MAGGSARADDAAALGAVLEMFEGFVVSFPVKDRALWAAALGRLHRLRIELELGADPEPPSRSVTRWNVN
jgi:hypothetical protein